MTVHTAHSIFFFGIAGSGMRGLAYLLHQSEKRVSGTDTLVTDASSMPPGFEAYDIIPESDPKTLDIAASNDLIIYSDALGANHPVREYENAISYSEALGQFSGQYNTIAIAGTHGKSSTTAFLAHILIEAGMNPTVLVGAGMKDWPESNARAGAGKLFIVEADEYRHHFLHLTPRHAIITSIDFDHPDYFSRPEDSIKAYGLFLEKIQEGGTVVIPPALKKEYPDLAWPPETLEAKSNSDTPMPIPGDHMRQNAALAIAMAERLGITPSNSAAFLQTFPGLKRRFEVLGEVGRITLVTDYAHHPAEVEATLQAAKKAYPGKHITALFEAHMYERLQTFFDQYLKALGLADNVLFYPPFSPTGRDAVSPKNTALVSDFIEELSKIRPVATVSSGADILEYLESNKKTDSAIITLSAGNLDAVLRSITG